MSLLTTPSRLPDLLRESILRPARPDVRRARFAAINWTCTRREGHRPGRRHVHIRAGTSFVHTHLHSTCLTLSTNHITAGTHPLLPHRDRRREHRVPSVPEGGREGLDERRVGRA